MRLTAQSTEAASYPLTFLLGGRTDISTPSQQEIYGMFLKDKAGTIAKAAQNWPKIMSKAPAEL